MSETESNETGKPPLAGLGEADAAAVDAFFSSRNQDADARPEGEVDSARVERVAALMSVLDRAPAAEPPSDLVARTLARAQRARTHERAIEANEPIRGPIFSFGWGQAAGVAAVLALALSVALPGLANFREQARQLACRAHLAGAGAAFNQYGQDHEGAMPRLGSWPGAAWWKVGEGENSKGEIESNSAHLFSLVTNGYANLATLTCPGNDHAVSYLPEDATDWPTAESISYSYQNQYTPTPLRIEDAPDTAVLADKNPLFAVNPRGYLEYATNRDHSSASDSHQARGQNVLLVNGGVQWTEEPKVNNGDNIWLINGVNKYSGRERPTSANDAFLVP